MTLGSLFDGSGTCPLAASMVGITPIWASEIEPFPIAVTSLHFPYMKHLGDITKINGALIEPVDIITFGSPCQDLSVAGKRAGLQGERSSLVMEAVRIVKEMRKATNGEYPRYIVWENVLGAFSSNRGRDFRNILDSFIQVVEPGIYVPLPEKGRWPHAGLYMGDTWSIAYRTFDAQYWGVPQRRKRVFLVGDFGGQRAYKILFERKGLHGNYKASGEERETVAGTADNGAQQHDRIAAIFSGEAGSSAGSIAYSENISPTLKAGESGWRAPCVIVERHLKDRTVHLVRKLTPTECASLQGFPKNWCVDIPHSDGAEYKLWGNGMALPCVLYIMEGIKDLHT